MSNVYVIGSGGMIGSALISQRLSTPFNVHKTSLDWKNISQGDFEKLHHLIKQIKINEIGKETPPIFIWTAGKTHPNSESDECHKEFLNTKLIIDKISEKIKFNLIYCSSGGSIFKPSEDIRYETSEPSPTSYYGEMKLKLELYLDRNLNKEEHQFSIIRLPNVFGTKQDLKKNQGIVTKLINLQEQEFFKLKVTIDSKKNYISSYDVGRFILYLLNHNKKLLKSQKIIHLPALNNVYSISDIINLVKPIKKIQVLDLKVDKSDTVFLDSLFRDSIIFDLSNPLDIFVKKELKKNGI